MSVRVIAWSLGFLGGAVLAAFVPEALFPGVRPVVFGAALLAVGLLGEWAQTHQSGPLAGPPGPPRDARPADGRVDLATIPHVERSLNAIDPRFGRFEAFRGLDDGARRTGPSRKPQANPPLLGRVALVSIFVGHDGRRWSDGDIARVHEAIVRAGTWVEREAQRWGAAVNVEVVDTYFEAADAGEDEVAIAFDFQGDEVVTMEEHAERKALAAATRVAVGHGFRDAEDLVRSVEARLSADAAVWLLHPLRAGGSLALTADRPQALLDGVSLAVCYAREASFPEPLVGPARTDPVSVVHEMLHLFGATDKYGRSIRDYAPRAVTSREVMRLDETRLGRLRVDPQTALEIGWVGPETPAAGASPGGSRRPLETNGEDIEG